MRQNIDDYLAFEIKKELADRYFGFRKLIEDNISDYDKQIHASSQRLEQKTGYDLIRIYILLKDENLIHDFIQLSGLQEKFFFDPYITESPTLRKKVFSRQHVSGLTRAGRFKNLVFYNYDCLERHILDYRTSFMKIDEEREIISEEINLFYQKNDLSSIMGFLRGLDGTNSFKSGDVEGAFIPQNGNSLEKKLKVTPPPPTNELLPDIQPIVSLDQVKKPLKKLINSAYKLHGKLDWKEIINS